MDDGNVIYIRAVESKLRDELCRMRMRQAGLEINSRPIPNELRERLERLRKIQAKLSDAIIHQNREFKVMAWRRHGLEPKE